MAYGVNAPFGLRPYSSISGGSWTEKTNEYSIFANAATGVGYASSIFTGDPVIFNPALATSNQGTPTIAVYAPNVDGNNAANAIPVLGVFAGCEYTLPNGTLVKSPYWPASTTVMIGSRVRAYIIDDPDVVWDIQVSTTTNVLNDARFSTIIGAGTQPAVPACFGQNFGFGLAGGGANLVPNNPTTGTTSTGQSAFYLNTTFSANPGRTLATLPLKALGFTQDPNNVVLASSNDTTINPFLNVRVVINHHVYRTGTLGQTFA